MHLIAGCFATAVSTLGKTTVAMGQRVRSALRPRGAANRGDAQRCRTAHCYFNCPLSPIDEIRPPTE
ncbi:unnamed protein product [Hydatigera taeniaeformis]|uniref:Secreted protein n=1 Tax=Hydatigena taeniaeformis TaxID=6205 RepID=A0A0R3X1A9_HYDTA|nr:unnamed protein product [Hydatigera taeniaeformis]